MAVIIFKLNGVPDEEADEVRALLTEKGFEFYETSAGRWGISVAALWLKNNADQPAARALIETFQQHRQTQIKAEHEQLREQGKLENALSRLLHNPLQVIFYILFILLIIYLSLSPFVFIGK
ncbi:DUF6164 family protein [Sulfuriflexus mobilis]|uniref:DUF6164 family protein n=1 Tax=Sulfuriflexus mobilis TaxID=1811807 RepID=UPI000F83C68A|nr:DUF6164 family protein [Sulfuriflexus mobilis]